MSEGGRRSGACLCGAVRFEAVPAKAEMDVCHCSICRRWSGGVFMSVPCSELDIAGEALGRYASSSYGERLFCTACGSSLAWRMQDHSLIAVSMQAFESSEDFRFTDEIFVDEKPAQYSFAERTRKLTGAQVLAQFENSEGA